MRKTMMRTLGWGAVFVIAMLATGCGSLMQPNARGPAGMEPPPAVPPPSAPPVATMPPPAATPRIDTEPMQPVPPAPVIPRVEPIPSGSPNVPYVIDGVRYVPENDDVAMNEVGIASWYGKPFHGRKTANGERYDMHRMTAAHKTMPLPSYALVRNRANGKEVIVRVNDRGPFKRGRVIDLSYAAAKVIGIAGLGTVEVIRLTRDAIRLGLWRVKGALTFETVASAETLRPAR